MSLKKHSKSGTLLIVVLCLLGFAARSVQAFDCVDAATNSMRSDEKLLEQLKALSDPVSIECLGALIKGNHFKSVNHVIDTLDSEIVDQAIDATKEASQHVMDKYDAMLDKIKEQKN